MKKHVPSRFTIDDDQDDVDIVINRRGGEKITITFPKMTVARARRTNWYQGRVNALTAELAVCTDDEEAERLEVCISQHHEKMLQCIIPDLPVGLLDTLGAHALQQLVETITHITGQSEQATAS